MMKAAFDLLHDHAGRAGGSRDGRLRISRLASFALIVATAACAPLADPARTAVPMTTPGGAPSAPGKTLVMIARAQPDGVASRGLRQVAGRTIDTTLRLWNAGLALNDNRKVPAPYLAETLPQLNSDSWRVFPDGRMETTYRLKPNLVWHDGTPLTAEDFVFSWQVYSTPELGESGLAPFSQLEEIQAPDARTIVLRWRQPYAEAGALVAGQQTGFQPLPRHLLERPFATAASNPDAFAALTFWTGDYVGLGPFKVSRYEPGTMIEGAAFDQHALGRARIDRVSVRFMSDANTVLANLLSGDAHIAIDDSMRFQQAVVLQRDWAPRGAGVVILSPAQFRYESVQLRPEVAMPRALLDVRARRALVHAIDRQALSDALLEGQGLIAEAMIVPQVEYFPEVERAITRYPYDLRRTEQLLGELGYTRGSDGVYTHPGEGRFAIEVRVLASAANETEAAVIADSLRRAGMDSSIHVVSQAEAQDGQIRASFPGLSASSVINGFAPPLDRLRAGEIATPDTRWRGSNFGGWNNPDFERLAASYEASLARSERNALAVQMMKLVSEQAPTIPLFYNFMVTPHVADLAGPTDAVSAATAGWNVHEWRWLR
jgi:peptide/nickel transport system substrate-binding protein